MSELDSYESLQLLHADLVALSESELPNLERLLAELEARIEEFRGLLDKSSRNEQSRKSLTSGKIQLAGVEYEINEDFQQGALQLADVLNLDELAAAQIFLEAQNDSTTLGRSVLECSIIRFHQRRKYILDCLRLIFQQSADVNKDEATSEVFEIVMDAVVQPREKSGNSLKFTQKCIASMGDIKLWLQDLGDKLNSASILGDKQKPEFLETIEYQRVSLVQQHETLAIILFYLIKKNHSTSADFEMILNTIRKADKYDNLLLHYFPALGSYITQFGSPEGNGSIDDARALNGKVLHQTDQQPWTLSYVHAAIRAWWIAEYSGWYGENYDGSAATNIDVSEESKNCSKQFADALKDGAFDFILSISADVKSSEWHDPARHGLRQWLQRKAPPLLSDSVPFSTVFQGILMDQLEIFIEGFITNLPDVLRKLRTDEDEQRQLSQVHEHDLDLERFMVIISYAFEGRPKAAMEGFWDVPDGALMGFMNWASRRASTPLVSAFCEMLQAISEDEECATAAHEFLLDESTPSSGKMRRSHSLTWKQIFNELTFFSNRIRDRPALSQAQPYHAGKPSNDQVEAEPESAMMLECYLRLISRLGSESGVAKQFMLQHPTFHLTDLLFQLASSSILPRLRACAFNTLRSLLSHKTKMEGEHIWTSLDIWISGGYAPQSSIPKTAASATTSSHYQMEGIFMAISAGFEEPNSFIQLLNALVAPYEDEAGLYDALPFPESLGSSSRMPGIDPYVDFAVGQIFGSRSPEIHEPVQLRLLQLSCLNFIITCLESFNEDLLIFGNQSKVAVDAAIRTSNLANYVLLHPFSRVMEWMFSDKVMAALFAAIHQDLTAVGNASPDSPLIMCIILSIRVITLIIDLQPTYLDIVRPLIKLQPSHRRLPVSNSAFASFEDGILNNLFVVADLGLYCGTGHPELVTVSLKLLEKLSASPKLSANATGRRGNRNKVIAALEANNDAEAISVSFVHSIMQVVDLDGGANSQVYQVKDHILNFLVECLRTSPNSPTIAHLLLGWKCNDNTVDIDSGSAFSLGTSLFHAILNLAVETPLVIQDSNVSPWLVSLEYKGLQILKQLWLSPLSSKHTMAELRASEFLFIMFSKQPTIQPGMLWDGLEITDNRFLFSNGASTLARTLSQRALVLQYAAAELRQVVLSHTPSLKQRIFRTLLGSTTTGQGEQFQHASIFDFFDFMELEFEHNFEPPQLSWFQDINLDACVERREDTFVIFSLKKVEELLALRRAELINTRQLENPQDATLIDSQARDFIGYITMSNRAKELVISKLAVLRAWVQLMLVMIEANDFDGSTKATFALQTFQTILPRLENAVENGQDIVELARLAKALVFSHEVDTSTSSKIDTGDLLSERLFQLFQISLRAIYSPATDSSSRDISYSIGYRYLIGIVDTREAHSNARQHALQATKAAGERLIHLICDDAYSSEQTCRIAALLFLGSLVQLGKLENSKYITDSLTRLNFVGTLVNSIPDITGDLQETPRGEVDAQLSCFNARLALLLQISQTRAGATAVLNSGLFNAVKVSGLFATDPDLGVDIDDVDALRKHYDLLIALMRVIITVVLSRGPQNEQTLEQGRKFLSENRLSILGVLKRSAGLGISSDSPEQSIEELADSFVMLISITGFIDFEDQLTTKRPSLSVFT
ncbi:nucleoporin Nup186/Nup192/Nup205 [Xylogone sp. PMI_703]|nr:nucleoporin Nup186/Nup192/Nup205 [Xylogone sp. PMI_703]